jgi:glycosyltransferase involved in cell wall biosynthesis
VASPLRFSISGVGKLMRTERQETTMRIAQVAPLTERVPPHFYGGTERIVSYLSEELLRQGHEVTLFASGDSITRARLIAPCDRSLRLDPRCTIEVIPHLLQLKQVLQHAASFDVIHFHTDYLHFPLAQLLDTPHVTTVHGRLDLPDFAPFFEEFPEVPLVSISDSQRAPLPSNNWQATVYHGLPADLYDVSAGGGRYLAFLGRISPEKRVDRAIEIAQRAGIKLKIAAKIDPTNKEYMETEIHHLLDDPLVEFVGEVDDRNKAEFLGKACALLFPIDWVEPFGLVMIEAMACGTPTIAFRQGSVPEIIEDGVTGFIVDSIEESLLALERIPSIDRNRCRRTFERRFASQRMAADYVRIYQALVDQKRRMLDPKHDQSGGNYDKSQTI